MTIIIKKYKNMIKWQYKKNTIKIKIIFYINVVKHNKMTSIF